ncbi:MAG: L-glutamate gamma-semialdehyde dehydrogenase [Desulfovibrionaceae bacterium]
MSNPSLEQAIRDTGRAFFAAIKGEAPSIFNKGFWTGKVMDWAMKNEDFKVQLFRFVDVLPYLTTSDNLNRHIQEYFGGEADVPAVLKWGAGKSGMFGGLVGNVMGKAIRSNIENMGRQFIVGENTKEAVKNLAKLRKDGFAFTVDLLGEATLSEEEADAYRDGYLELLGALEKELPKWKPLADGKNDLDWGTAPKLNVSVKPSALYSQARPIDMQGSVDAIMVRLKPIARKVMQLGGFMCIDIEALTHRDMTIELFKQLRSDPEFIGWRHLSIVQQAYLRDTEAHLKDLVGWAREKNLPIAIRLVKGAYWDQEAIAAVQNGWPIPVWTDKAESDANHEKLARYLLENSDIVYFQCASHNIRTISNALETAKALNVPDDRFEFQVLYGMAEPVRKGLLNVAKRVRLYCPYGELIPGMGYLVRRLLENTANESFLRQSFAEGEELEKLLGDPVGQIRATRLPAHGALESLDEPFRNEPMLDPTIAEERAAFPAAIAKVRGQLGKTYPLFIGGKEVATSQAVESVNPANPKEIIGRVSQAGKAEIDQAVAAAEAAFPAWRDTPARQRAQILCRAAAVMRRRVHEFSAWQILEVGKQWSQAFHDVGEAIDFLEYYAREMVRLDEAQRMGRAPGESNHVFYQPKGIAAVIGPWNFPLAIPTGMCAANIVCGNPVIFKPSNLSPVIGWNLVEAFREAGLPDGVFNYCPGSSREMGDYLVEHPRVAVISFTGSMEVGLHIQEHAAAKPGDDHCKRVVAEMGGKNAIVIDDDADLDEAVAHTLYSAFGFQGQKCSACSRVIVVDGIYDQFTDRLCKAADALKIGPGEDPGNYMGPVVDASAQKNILKYIEMAAQEGEILVRRDVPGEGYYVPLTIVGNITPEHRIAQEEVFGPVLAVMRAKDFDQAMAWANSTRFALTGGIFSRSPEHLERARKEFRVGNLYLNRNCTGAMVGRQPFGGFKMSGVGSKTGGRDYLIQFLDPRCVTENTMRRGFAPIEGGSDWIEYE